MENHPHNYSLKFPYGSNAGARLAVSRKFDVLEPKTRGILSKKSYETLIVYLPFKVPGRRIYEIQPNGHKHWNREEILNKTGGGDLKKNDIRSWLALIFEKNGTLNF